MTAEAFKEFERSIENARRMVAGARNLEGLQVRSFDVDGIYRQVWVSAVSAIDHWVSQEIRTRAAALFANPGEKPRKLQNFPITVERVERVYHRRESAEDVFREQLDAEIGWRSYQHPDKIKEGLTLVTDVPLWQEVAKRLDETTGHQIDATGLRDSLVDIVQRRNKIAHETDRDPASPDRRCPISADAVTEVVDWLHEVAAAILHVLDGGSRPSAGNSYLLVLSDGESVGWVLGASRMAFNPAIKSTAQRLTIGDTLYVVTTKNCWGSSKSATTLVVGTATVRTPVRVLDNSQRQHESSKYDIGCDLVLRKLAPFRRGVEFSDLVPELDVIKNKEHWGLHLQRALVPLSVADAEIVQAELFREVGDPIDYAGDYVNWRRG